MYGDTKGGKALASKMNILSHSAGEVGLLCQGKDDKVSQMLGVAPQHYKKKKKSVGGPGYFFGNEGLVQNLGTTRAQNITAMSLSASPIHVYKEEGP